MKRILSMELKKAFWNKRFLFSLSVALFLSLLSGFLQVRAGSGSGYEAVQSWSDQR